MPYSRRASAGSASGSATSADAEFAQLSDDIRHTAVAQIRNVFLERDADDADLGALDGPLRCDQQLDEALRDEPAHAVVDAPAGEDDLRIIVGRLRPGGQVIRIDADTMPADQCRR